MDEEGRPTFLSVIVTFLALLLQIVGLATPGWYYVRDEYESVEMHVGLWYMVYCGRSICAVHSLVIGANQTFTATMNVYRGLTVAGAIACLVVLILLIVSRKSTQPTPTVVNITILFYLLVSGVLAITAAAKFAIGLIDVYFDAFVFPYSTLITCIGGIWAIITFFVLMCKTVCRSRRNVNRAASQGGMVMMMNPAPYTIGEV